MKRPPLNKTLWNAMLRVHTHAEIANEQNPEQIVYYEKDVIKLIKQAVAYGKGKANTGDAQGGQSQS